MRDAGLRLLNAAEILGICGALAHAITDDARAFYEAVGFMPSPSYPMMLMIGLKDLSNALSAFKYTHDRFKWIAMHAHPSLDLLGTVSGMSVKRIPGTMPIASREIDIFLLNQARNGPDISEQLRMLPDPADVSAR